MRNRNAIAWRYDMKCDVCGFEESAEVRDSHAEFVNGWRVVAFEREWNLIASMALNDRRDVLDVCSRACADKYLADYADSVFRKAEAVPA